MTVKVVLVHVAADADSQARAVVGAELAHRLGARVKALYTLRPAAPPVVGRALQLYLDMAQKSAADAMETVRRRFEVTCGGKSVPFDWVSSALDPVEALADASYFADLAIVSQTELHTLEDFTARHMPEHLALHAGLPVLVLPRGVCPTNLGQRIIIAWKRTREAANAVHRALPLLSLAEKVTVVVVQGSPEDAESAASCVEWLGYHGIKAERVLVDGDDHHPGAMIHQIGEERGADLVVMGLYGHSRMRELVLGGATSEMLLDSRLTMLTAH